MALPRWNVRYVGASEGGSADGTVTLIAPESNWRRGVHPAATRRSVRLSEQDSGGGVAMAAAKNGRVDDKGLPVAKKFVKRCACIYFLRERVTSERERKGEREGEGGRGREGE